MTEITSEAELHELLGEPLPRVATKDRPALHDYDKRSGWPARPSA